MTIDTHTHVLSPDREAFPRDYALDMAWARGDLAAEHLLAEMDRSAVSQAVLIQAFSAYRNDNAYVRATIARYPARFIGVCMVDPLREGADADLSVLVSEQGFAGARLVFVGQEPALDSAGLHRFYATCEHLEVPLCVLVAPGRLSEVERVLQRFPGLRIAIEHMGLIHVSQEPAAAREQRLLALSRHPNCFIKFSTLNLRAAAAFDGGVQGQFERLIAAYGSTRLMWGSDYPSTPEGGLQGLAAYAHELLEFLDARSASDLFGQTAARFWPALARNGAAESRP